VTTSKKEVLEKLSNFLNKIQQEDTGQIPFIVVAALLMLKRVGRCRFRPGQKEIEDKVIEILEAEGIRYSKPKIRYGYIISLYYTPASAAV